MKRRCPYHNDVTASLKLYNNGFYCFGCGASGPLTKLGIGAARAISRPIEDVGKTLAYIDTLPTARIRGLDLPHDEEGYYIVYQDPPYYLKRLKEPGGRSKYRGPAGHPRPILKKRYGSWVTRARGPLLAVEGELNALSAAQGMGYGGPIRAVASPGGAASLTSPEFVQYCLEFKSVAIIVDKDAAGVVAGLELKQKLVAGGTKAMLYPMVEDFNKIYDKEDGTKAVQTEVAKILGLLEGV